jgi:uncharacterized protein (UPF0212 family)
MEVPSMADRMANHRIDDRQMERAAQSEDSIEDPAHRHVGKTLESEPENFVPTVTGVEFCPRCSAANP